MTTRLYTPTFKQYDHTGYIVPQVEHSDSNYPAAEIKPAAWLPVERYDKKFEVYSVIASGKPVALDREGHAVPAGYALSFEQSGATTILTYTATDYTEGTTDLTTGVAYATNGTTTYTQTQVTTALQSRGLIDSTEYARDFVSPPIGYAPYTYFQWVGGDGWNPAQYRQHNHNLQHQVAVGTDRVLSAPMVPAQTATETQGGGLAISGGGITFGTGGWHTSAGISASTRYSSLVSSGDNVVAMSLARYPVAKITDNTAITDSASTLAAMTEVSSIADVKNGGSDYFYIDYEVGVLFLYEVGGNAIPTGFSVANTITYYQYETAATGSADIVQALGNLQPGDYVTFDSTSNYTKWAPDIGTASGAANGIAYAADPDYGAGADSTISAQLEAAMYDNKTRVVGQVLAIWEWPRSSLDRVMTQYRTLTAYERMPGTATGGMSDALVQSGGANRVAIINFINR
jgi:hypothetical protein